MNIWESETVRFIKISNPRFSMFLRHAVDGKSNAETECGKTKCCTSQQHLALWHESTKKGSFFWILTRTIVFDRCFSFIMGKTTENCCKFSFQLLSRLNRLSRPSNHKFYPINLGSRSVEANPASCVISAIHKIDIFFLPGAQHGTKNIKIRSNSGREGSSVVRRKKTVVRLSTNRSLPKVSITNSHRSLKVFWILLHSCQVKFAGFMQVALK